MPCALGIFRNFTALRGKLRKLQGYTVVQLAYRPPADDEEEATETVHNMNSKYFYVFVVGGGKEVGKKWERSGEAEFSKMQPSAI